MSYQWILLQVQGQLHEMQPLTPDARHQEEGGRIGIKISK